MTPVVLVPPAGGTPTTPTAPTGGLLQSWTGWDGSVWNLSDPTISGIHLGSGVRGMGAPESQVYASESPALAGSRFRSSRVTSRDVFWPLSVLHDSGAEWVGRDGAFWRTMRADAPGSWSVTAPDGSTRSLRCRWVSGGDEGYEVDPTRSGWAMYGVYLLADDDPFWSGTPLVRSWSPGVAVDFFDPTGPTLFHISPGNLLATATMPNVGDVDAYPIWRIDGPVTDVTLGVDGRVIEVPITVADGESLTVDTDPRWQTAIRSTGVDVTADLGAVDFAPVPPGAVVPLSLDMTGTGRVTATLTPRYLRAFG